MVPRGLLKSNETETENLTEAQTVTETDMTPCQHYFLDSRRKISNSSHFKEFKGEAFRNDGLQGHPIPNRVLVKSNVVRKTLVTSPMKFVPRLLGYDNLLTAFKFSNRNYERI